MKLVLRELDPWTFRTICLLVGGGGLLALVRGGDGDDHPDSVGRPTPHA
jgi:hypothetical protein